MSVVNIISKRAFFPNLLLAPLKRRFRYWKKSPRRTTLGNNKHSIHRRRVQPNMELEVYWLDAKLGSGPAASLYVDDDEIMRLDCLGRSTAHMHLNMKQALLIPRGHSARLWFPPGSLRDHVDRARHELVHNANYALRTNRRSVVRRTKTDPASLARAGDWMHDVMNRLIAQNDE